MKTVSKLFISSAVILTVLVFVALFATSVSATQNQYCANGSSMTGQELENARDEGKVVITVSTAGTSGLVRIVNSTNCTIPMSFSSYKVFNSIPPLSTQQFYDGTAVTTVQANSTTNLAVVIPACQFQLDVWYQDAPHQLYDQSYMNPNILPFAIYGTIPSPYLSYCTSCTTHATKQCVGNAVYNFNSCGTQEDLYQQCATNQTCQNAQCVNLNIACSTSSQCGTNAYTGSPFCQSGNNVYQNYITCNNAGTSTSYCSDSTASQLKSTCTVNQTCTNGSCGSNCTSHSSQQCSGSSVYWYNSCGAQEELVQFCANGCTNGYCAQNNSTVQTNSATNIYNSQATLNGYLYNNNNNCTNYVWFQYGQNTNYGTETTHQTQTNAGAFSQNINLYSGSGAYHFRAVAQLCSGGTVYGQDMTFSATGYNGSLTISKTVRNMTSGNSNWSSTTYASPSDTLMFMITIQATGSQNINNILVRDMFPANLIYRNQLVVSGSSNYSGDITSGINIGTISAGQTITITYQAQVASLQNFSYGTTTLNNSVSVTSSDSTSNPTSSASVSVTRSAVYGASSVATGLTNNLLVDSFILPLMLALIGLWMFKSGMFTRIEKWADSHKKTSKGYKAEKELNYRIAQIREAERA